MKQFYRLFSLTPTARSSHLRSWVSEHEPQVLLDYMAMFGCKAMANISMRTSQFACFIVQWFLNKLAPQTSKAKRAFELMAQAMLDAALKSNRSDEYVAVSLRLCIALIGFYIDDWAVLTITGHETVTNQAVTAAWELFGLPEEPTKTLDFETS